MLMKIGVGDKGMDMVEGMVMEIKISREGPMGGYATQTQTYYTTPKERVSYRNAPSRRIGGRQGDSNGNGEDKNDKNRKRYRDTKYDFEEKEEEESDTEDPFEFEITPQQLNQVTPGGGF